MRFIQGFKLLTTFNACFIAFRHPTNNFFYIKIVVACVICERSFKRSENGRYTLQCSIEAHSVSFDGDVLPAVPNCTEWNKHRASVWTYMVPPRGVNRSTIQLFSRMLFFDYLSSILVFSLVRLFVCQATLEIILLSFLDEQSKSVIVDPNCGISPSGWFPGHLARTT